MTYAELIRRLRPFGVEFRRQGKGAHMIWGRPALGRYTSIPNHPGREIPTKTLAKILKDLDLTFRDVEGRR